MGFDSDPPSIFEQQIRFIRRIGVVTAMVGLLHAVPRSPLLSAPQTTRPDPGGGPGNDADGALKFIPKMDTELLVDGYRQSSTPSTQGMLKTVRTFLQGC